MSAAILLLLAVLASQCGLNHHEQVDVSASARMKQHEEYMEQQMTRLLQEIENIGSPRKVTLLSVLASWQFRVVATLAAMVGAWWNWKRNLDPEDCSDLDSSSSTENEEEERATNSAHRSTESLLVTPSPMEDVQDTQRMLEALFDDLLGVCRVLCRKTFMPQMEPAKARSGTSESWDVQENSITYFLDVSLRPPHGHTFSLEPDTTGQMPGRSAKVRVGLECMCSREQLLGDTVCFLHHSSNSLPRHQGSYLLCNLCTRSCLDLEKVSCWVQHLVSSAWLLLPQSYHWQLKVLPSSTSCVFKLTGISKMDICTELSFAVQLDSTGASLVLQ
ncbi:inositol 1,4,5-trisphosphate receptor-interacting protein-like 1 [Pogoniulus pusillus]|uniref:inositol 1,4,5-trisphosphate receptor-interacting protein-like 1 n=1 Tax=Pogoniulus pusillus TaxID=488313 RepID=UPI0030B9A961